PTPKAPLLKSLAIGLCALSLSGNILSNVNFIPHGSLLLTTYSQLPPVIFLLLNYTRSANYS
ncbi:MAG: hypothetical protein U0L77_04680, partial [Prevotellamassilia sp.]|nr:hypothetical protein [Prevotellamassilia sp.]